jgi:C1A family cysteine protease
MKAILGKYHLGWLPDYPDFRDYTLNAESVRPVLEQTGILRADATALPATTDLRKWCSPVEDQGQLGSCTANAGVGMVEYFERKAFGKHVDASRLFLYKATRDLMQQTGDTGGYLRTTMGALALFGAPPEEYWPYAIDRFDAEPPAFCYAFAQNFQAMKYVRLDPEGKGKPEILSEIRKSLATGLPAMFGFTVYSSIGQATRDGRIPFPDKGDRVEGGHAIMAVGYDDRLEIRHPASDATTKGAFLIRNSWGPGWGMDGYGWLPYDYVLKDLALDWWTIVDSKWIDTGAFRL